MTMPNDGWERVTIPSTYNLPTPNKNNTVIILSAKEAYEATVAKSAHFTNECLIEINKKINEAINCEKTHIVVAVDERMSNAVRRRLVELGYCIHTYEDCYAISWDQVQ